jgi:uncharacterized protein (DUF305 family)
VTSRVVLAAAVLLGAAACQSTGGSTARVVQPGAPGTDSKVVAPAPASSIRHTAADVRFMRGMIGHHAQALEMTALLPARTSQDGMKLLAKRIEVSQTDEIKLMSDWLRARGETPPDAHAHHMPGATLMPGMLTADEMARLTAATGVEFDRLFLALMIKHHEGALVMVKDLFASPGAGQDGEIFAFASDVEADQTMEIQRMRLLLKELSR